MSWCSSVSLADLLCFSCFLLIKSQVQNLDWFLWVVSFLAFLSWLWSPIQWRQWRSFSLSVFNGDACSIKFPRGSGLCHINCLHVGSSLSVYQKIHQLGCMWYHKVTGVCTNTIAYTVCPELKPSHMVHDCVRKLWIMKGLKFTQKALCVL